MNPLLLATACLSAAWLAGAGCASAPKEEPPVAAKEPACGNDVGIPLHMVSARPDATRVSADPRIESILNQQPADPRLAWVNRQMYQSLHALDVELRREQRIAECERSEAGSPMLEAQAAGGGAGATPVPVSDPGAATTSPPATAPAAAQNSTASGAAAPGAPRSTLIRKASLSATGGGGNGATAQKFTAGSDNDIVARRLRKAAEQETNPTLRAKLWKEYADYKQALTARP